MIGSLNEKTRYVIDDRGKKTCKYDIQKDDTISNKTLFVELGCDGMTVDESGNVYFTTNGKSAEDIFSPTGELTASIPVPEKPSNVCFGGKDRNQLYITTRTSIYRVNLETKGVDCYIFNRELTNPLKPAVSLSNWA